MNQTYEQFYKGHKLLTRAKTESNFSRTITKKTSLNREFYNKKSIIYKEQ
jgi:hypothetical protein